MLRKLRSSVFSRKVIGLNLGLEAFWKTEYRSPSLGTTVTHIVTRPVWEIHFVANPVVIWGVPLGVAAAVVWVVAVVSDGVPAVVGTTGKITRRLNILIALGAVTPLSGKQVVPGSAEVGADAIFLSWRWDVAVRFLRVGGELQHLFGPGLGTPSILQGVYGPNARERLR